MELDRKDFRGLLFNVYEVPAENNILEVFPKLSSYKEFKISTEKIDNNKLLRYVIYVYDKKSPFVSKINDPIKVKVETALFLGFETVDGEFNKDILDIMMCKNDKVNRAIIRYCRIQNDEDWAYYKILQDGFYKGLEGIQVGDFKDNFKTVNEMKQILSDTRLSILNKDNNEILSRAFYSVFEEEDIDDVFPEGIAIKLSKGKKPLGKYNPYA